MTADTAFSARSQTVVVWWSLAFGVWMIPTTWLLLTRLKAQRLAAIE